MRYKEVLINSGTPLYTSINQYISDNDYEHIIEVDPITGIEKSRQTNVRILGIPESYNTNTERILTNKGYLFIKISDTMYHEYHIFDVPAASAATFGRVLIINEPLDFNNATYENTHRLVLYRRSYTYNNNEYYYYYADAIKCGFSGEYDDDGNEIYLYRLDVDGYIKQISDQDNPKIYYPEDDGYFHVTHEATGIRYFLISYKQYMYIHLNPANNVSIKLVDLNGMEISSKLYNFDDDNYYIDIETNHNTGESVDDPDEGLDTSLKTLLVNADKDDNNYMYITFIGDDGNAPEQLLVEVN